MSYATPADFMVRYDTRVLGQLVKDDGTSENSAILTSDVVLQACLDDAAGDIVAAVIVGQRYSENDLAGLTGNSLSYLKRINCDIAMRYLADRRAYAKVNETLERIWNRGEKALADLREGTTMFNITAQVAASVPVVAGPTTQTLQNLNTIRRLTQHFYPTETLPGNR